VRGEHFAFQALFYAATREPNRAQTFAADARNASRALEPQVLSLLAEAILALGQGDADAAAARLHFVIDSGIWDPVVIALRAAPELGVFLAEQADRRSWLQRLLFASSDTSLANRLGLGMPRGAKRPAELTPRESEVHELVAQGLTNEEIAKQLYISLSTTKVHVKHIYEKLGVRSRLEAARALRDDV
jgi:DNA-binding CsgD family transcriptional regulator